MDQFLLPASTHITPLSLLFIMEPSKSTNFLRPEIEMYNCGDMQQSSPYIRNHRRKSKVDDIEVLLSTVKRTFKSPKSSEHAENKKKRKILENQQKLDKKDSGVKIVQILTTDSASSIESFKNINSRSSTFSEQASVIHLTNQFLNKRKERRMSISQENNKTNSQPIMNPPKIVMQNALG